MRNLQNLLDQVASCGQPEDETWMPDKLFFPLTVVLAGLLIFMALRPAMGALPTGPVSVGDLNYNQVTVDDIQLNRISAGGDVAIDLVRDDETEPSTHLRIETVAGTLSDDPVLGPHFPLAEDLELQFAGYTLEVAVRAKPALPIGATQMKVNYSTGRDGESGWQVFDLRPDWHTFRFTYDVPEKVGENALDYLAIRPVTPDKTRAILIDQVVFTRRGRWSDEQPQG